VKHLLYPFRHTSLRAISPERFYRTIKIGACEATFSSATEAARLAENSTAEQFENSRQ
jgi:hypothetical protein